MHYFVAVETKSVTHKFLLFLSLDAYFLYILVTKLSNVARLVAYIYP